MEMFLGFMVLLACLLVGVRHGGIGLAVISGIGLVIFTFYRRYVDDFGGSNLRGIFANFRRLNGYAQVRGKIPAQQS